MNALITFSLLTLVVFVSCKKDGVILNSPPHSSITSIHTLDDAQAVLDYTTVMQVMPVLGEISADDFFLPIDTTGITQVPVELNTYYWHDDPYLGLGDISDWNTIYKQILQANTALEALPFISDTSDILKKNAIRGAAYFFRAHGHLNIALQFSSLPDLNSSAPGIPLRLSTDAAIKSKRATVSETYGQIITDLSRACTLLPIDSKRKYRPSKPAAYGLLARLYLYMGDYAKAELYSDSCLLYYSTLVDYNKFSPSAGNPFASNNGEVIFSATLLSSSIFESNSWYIDTILYRSYHVNDLRKNIFFQPDPVTNFPIKQHLYSGNHLLFSGIATDEIFLIRAEARAKNGDPNSAMNDLNNVLEKRWATGSLVPLSAASAENALMQIRVERRKELILRGQRWLDIRRYNRESPGPPLTRITMNNTYKLHPNDPKFILLIPPDVIQLSGMPQNER